MLENDVDSFGLDKSKYTNAVDIREIKIGTEVYVFDLSSYRQAPDTPIKGVIKEIDPYPYVVVTIEGKDYEVYARGFGFKINENNGSKS